MTLKELYDGAVNVLDECGIASPEVDAFYLLEYATGTDRTHYLLNKDKEVLSEIQDSYMELVRKRAEHIPYQYITGETQFMGYSVWVTPDVLIPRLDTEILCEAAAGMIMEGSRVLDMCTGSGCLAVAVKCMRPGAEVTACDISEEALKVAGKNAQRNDAYIRFVRSDLFDGLENEVYDIIFSNPPYVTESEYLDLDPEVRDNEPKLALTAGEDGMDIYRRLVPESCRHLAKGGWLIMEMGCTQGECLSAMMLKCGYTDIKIIKDLAGLDRVIMGRTAL